VPTAPPEELVLGGLQQQPFAHMRLATQGVPSGTPDDELELEDAVQLPTASHVPAWQMAPLQHAAPRALGA
jgi:hypothetical protein